MPLSMGNLINFLNPAAPKGLIDSAAEWVTRRRLKDDIRSLQPSAWCRKLDDEEETIYHDPELGPAGDFPELPNVRWTVSPDTMLFYVPGARILGAEAVVIAPDNRVFREFSYPPGLDWLKHSCFRRRRIPQVRKLKGWFATITYPSSGFYFHWMMESLPRMRFLKDYLHILDGVIVPGPILSFHRSSLAALGVSADKLLSVTPGTHLELEHLFIPKYCVFYNPAAWVHRWYKEAFLGKNATRAARPATRKIYISRSDANARKIRNEPEIIDCLAQLGFDAVTLTGMDFLDQARTFFDADFIVGAHGAGLSNLYFCRPGARVLEICPPNWMPPCYFTIAKSAGLAYSYIVADEYRTKGAHESPQALDITVPADLLVRRVAEILESMRAQRESG